MVYLWPWLLNSHFIYFDWLFRLFLKPARNALVSESLLLLLSQQRLWYSVFSSPLDLAQHYFSGASLRQLLEVYGVSSSPEPVLLFPCVLFLQVTHYLVIVTVYIFVLLILISSSRISTMKGQESYLLYRVLYLLCLPGTYLVLNTYLWNEWMGWKMIIRILGNVNKSKD